MAVMVLFAVVNVTIFLVLGGLASRTYGSNNHSVLLTSIEWIRVFAQFIAVCSASILAVERRISPLFTSPDGTKIGDLLKAHASSNSPTSVNYKV
jgi:hypothetical protein